MEICKKRGGGGMQREIGVRGGGGERAKGEMFTTNS
jgi:hypothetical protein